MQPHHECLGCSTMRYMRRLLLLSAPSYPGSKARACACFPLLLSRARTGWVRRTGRGEGRGRRTKAGMRARQSSLRWVVWQGYADPRNFVDGLARRMKDGQPSAAHTLWSRELLATEGWVWPASRSPLCTFCGPCPWRSLSARFVHGHWVIWYFECESVCVTVFAARARDCTQTFFPDSSQRSLSSPLSLPRRSAFAAGLRSPFSCSVASASLSCRIPLFGLFGNSRAAPKGSAIYEIASRLRLPRV